MGKALPIVGMVSAFFGLLAAMVLVDAAVFLPVPLLIAAAVMLFLERRLPGIVGGVVVLGLTVLAVLGLAGNVTTKGGGGADFGIGDATGRAVMVLALVAVPSLAAWSRWDDLEPRWLGFVGWAAAALAVILAFVNRDELANQQDLMTLVAGGLALASLAPMVVLLRAPPEPMPAATRVSPPTPARAPASAPATARKDATAKPRK